MLKNVIKVTAALIFMCAGSTALGLIEVPLAVGISLAAAGLFWYVCCIIYNCVYISRLKKKLTSTTAAGLYEAMTKRLEEVRADVENERKKVERTLLLSTLYNISLLAAVFLILTGVSMLINGTMLTSPELTEPIERFFIIFVTILYIYLIFGMIPTGALISAGNAAVNERERTYVIDEKSYPLLYNSAKRAAKAVKYDRPFILCRNLDDVGVSVSEYNGIVAVFLPPTEISLLTESELYHILLHEFAHAKNSDTEWLNRFENAKAKYSPDGGRIVKFIKELLFAVVSDKVSESVDEYRACSSLLVEQRADAAVKEHGIPQEYIDASAKSLMIIQFFSTSHPEIHYHIYESEEPIKDLFARKRALFEERLPSIYPIRRKVVLRTLEGKSDSHPTLRMRMEACGVDDFDVFKRPEGDYLEEVMRYLDDCGAICGDFDGWEHARREYYLDVNEHIETYEKKISEGIKPNRFEVWSALYGYWRANPEKALKLADEVLETAPDDTHANAVKGTILCGEDAEGGTEALRKAIDGAEPYLALSLMESYGSAVLRTGDKELLDKLRAEQTEIAQRQMDGIKLRIMDRKPSCKQLLPCDLSAKELDSLKEVLADYGEQIENVFIAKYMRGNLSVYLVKFNPISPRAAQKYDSFFEYLHMLESADRYFIPYYGTDKLDKSIAAIGTKLK